MTKIVALDGYTMNPGDLSWDKIGMLGELEVYNRSTRSQAEERALDADILIVNKFVIDKAFLDNCGSLKLVCVSATGYNNVDIDACTKRNIKVCNVSNYSTSGVAQHVFAMLMHWLNQIGKHNNLVKKGYWSICPDFSFTASPIHELSGKQFGILGYGDIGKKVAQIAKAFGMHVLVCRKSDTPILEDGVQKVDLDTLLSNSDMLSLHANLDESTHQIINKASLSKMKKNAILINTSRGGLINEMDLAECLMEEKIAAALLDVLTEEPAPLNHPFYQIRTCKITPHIAWATVQSRTRLMKSVEENIAAFLAGKPQNEIN